MFGLFEEQNLVFKDSPERNEHDRESPKKKLGGQVRFSVTEDVAGGLVKIDESTGIQVKVDKIISVCAKYGLAEKDWIPSKMQIIRKAVFNGYTDVKQINVVDPQSLSVVLVNKAGELLVFPLSVSGGVNDGVSYEPLIDEGEPEELDGEPQYGKMEKEIANSLLSQLYPILNSFKKIENPRETDKMKFASDFTKLAVELVFDVVRMSGNINEFSRSLLGPLPDLFESIKDGLKWNAHDMENLERLLTSAMISELDQLAKVRKDVVGLGAAIENAKESLKVN